MRKLITLVLLAAIVLVNAGCTGKTNTTTPTTIESQLPNPKNIIVLIGDGMGYNHVLAGSFYSHGMAGQQPFEGNDWIKFGMATYSSIMALSEDTVVYSLGYSPQNANTDYNYINSGYTDSGAGATSLSTGKKSYNGVIGLGTAGDTLTHLSEAAKSLGKSIGVVSSVPLSHATPAGFITHDESRSNYTRIAQSMFFNSKTDVIMATGNPGFDDDGNPAESDPKYVGGLEVWNLLTQNGGQTSFQTSDATFTVKDANGDGQPDAWTVIQTREEFQNMATGETPVRVLGVPQVYSTLQQSRSAAGNETTLYQTPVKETIPTLKELTSAALNVLDNNPEGFFVMIEGGAIDWASHDNNSIRTLEEMIAFNDAVQATIDWVEKNSSWEETLVIITADHETGYLTGVGEPNPLYPAVSGNGKGNIPFMQWNSGDHTNQLVPFYAKGPGSELFEVMAREQDPQHGAFIQNTDMASLIFLMWGTTLR